MDTTYMQIKKYEIECISPVHIGSGETLRAFEYLYDRRGQEVYFINETKWISFLGRHHLMDEFAKYIEATAGAARRKSTFHRDNVWEWLRKKGIPDTEIRNLGMTRSKAAVNRAQDKGTLNDIVRNVTLTDGNPYIPGSSVKGALRAGILYALIEKEPEKYRSYWDAVIQADGNMMDRRIFNELDSYAFARLNIPDGHMTAAGKSIMRGLSISDAVCTADRQDTVILQKIDATTKENKFHETEKALPLFRECIPAGAKFRFTMSVDKRIMGVIGVSTTDEILAMYKRYLHQALLLQQGIFGKQYGAEFKEALDADIILGGGTGFLTKTIFYALASSQQDGRRVLSDYLDMIFTVREKTGRRPAHNHKLYDRRISPRTLKLTRTRTERSIMGLCCINEVK